MRYNFLITAALVAALTVLGVTKAGEIIVQDTVITVSEAYSDNSSISISGPAAADTNKEITFYLIGTPVVDLSKPLLEQIDWLTGANRIKLFLLAPGQAKQLLPLRAELVFGIDGATLQPYSKISFTNPGQFRLALITDNNLVEHLIVIGGEPGPEPNPPNPQPDPDPTPVGPYQIMFFQDTDKADNLSKEQNAILSGITVRAHLAALGHTFKGSFDLKQTTRKEWRSVCKDGVCRQELVEVKVPAESLSPEVQKWAKWISENNVSLPAMVLWDGKSDKMIAKPLPETPDDLYEELGGK